MTIDHPLIDSNTKFEQSYQDKVARLLKSEPVNRGAAHAMKDDTTAHTLELMHVTEVFDVSPFIGSLQDMVQPNLPWAEDHFKERIGGEPLNPSPSEAWWPYARNNNSEHKVHDQKFSHTYPERFWPREAEPEGLLHYPESGDKMPRKGIRFEYGDLDNLVSILRKNPRSRQAYLPIWFPEDLTASDQGERVPCSLGYHFILNEGRFDCVYTMRSCDIVRFYRDDVYMAGRLLQWVTQQVDVAATGRLVVHVNNLHCFPGDRPFLEQLLPLGETQLNARASYNFDAMY